MAVSIIIIPNEQVLEVLLTSDLLEVGLKVCSITIDELGVGVEFLSLLALVKCASGVDSHEGSAFLKETRFLAELALEVEEVLPVLSDGCLHDEIRKLVVGVRS